MLKAVQKLPGEPMLQGGPLPDEPLLRVYA
jgi:hypothetical protein